MAAPIRNASAAPKPFVSRHADGARDAQYQDDPGDAPDYLIVKSRDHLPASSLVNSRNRSIMPAATPRNRKTILR